ncbi:Borealin N terminal-domain-containing protein [Echria macrotheca]|uniref:Borealin N terminal-domain-containing protein n=1 Tax=Echria macrotheca TaxID=438768 RepID=A0AAJ0BG90_9PEZI|nr:Borealin N terminal-domain-containing protein [Echria macrotheca]
MPPLRGRKRKSDESNISTDEMVDQRVPTKTGEETSQPSPAKKRKIGITQAQKQALIEDLQLEITERARRLRSNYNIHAQTLRTRVEMRVTRISRRLRDMTMGELIQKYAAQQQQQEPSQFAHRDTTKGPPVPEKDHLPGPQSTFRRPHTAIPISPARHHKRMSSEISGGDKENESVALDMPKKKARAGPATTDIALNPGKVLSPASSNSRLAPRERPPSPAKSLIARPVSPTKMATATSLLSNMVEKARSTRAAATNRKTTTSTTTSSSNGSASTTTSATGTTRGKRGGAAAPAARPATRTARRVSVISESSDGSTSTVVRKRPATAMGTSSAKAPAAKRTVMSSIKKGVGAGTGTGTGTTRKAATAKTPAAAPAVGTGRVLRKRT